MRKAVNESRMILMKFIGDTARDGFLQTVQVFVYTTEISKTNRLVLASRKRHDIPGAGK